MQVTTGHDQQELLPEPCPWCGTTEKLAVEHSTGVWSVACINDDCHVKPDCWFGNSRRKAIWAWNTHAIYRKNRKNAAFGMGDQTRAVKFICSGIQGRETGRLIVSALNQYAEILAAVKEKAQERGEHPDAYQDEECKSRKS